MKKIIINYPAFFIYIFFLIITFLAGMSMSGVLLFVVWLVFIFPLLSLTKIIIIFIRLKYFENFSSEHPLKGEMIKYNLIITNESKIFNTPVEIKFKSIYPGILEHFSDLNIFLKRGNSYSHEYSFTCPYRGIYTVGLEHLMFCDTLGWIKLYPEVWYRTFYVYPRIINLTKIPDNIQNTIQATGGFTGDILDNTLLKTLDEYRNGQTIKHLAWKKFFATGNPYLKSYEKTSLPGLDIFIDLRRLEDVNPVILEKEDCSIEIMVAFVKYFLDNNIHISIHGYGKNNFNFSGSSRDLFSDFHRSTINIYFHGNISPVQVFKAKSNSINSKSILFITHIIDPEIFNLITDSGLSDLSIFLIINQAGMSHNEIQKSNRYLNNLKEKGANIFVVKDSQTIKKDMESC